MGRTQRKGGKEAKTISYKRDVLKKQRASDKAAKTLEVSSGKKAQPPVIPLRSDATPAQIKRVVEQVDRLGEQIGENRVLRPPHQSPSRVAPTIVPTVSYYNATIVLNALNAADRPPAGLLEKATVRNFNADEIKMFGFATTHHQPNEDDRTELFFHLHGGCDFSFNPAHPDSEFRMVFRSRSDTPFRHPLVGDGIVFIRGRGVKGEKIVKWGYEEELLYIINEIQNPPQYRMTRVVTPKGGRAVSTVLWIGSNLADLRKMFPLERGGRNSPQPLFAGLTSASAGTVRIFFEQLDMEFNALTAGVSGLGHPDGEWVGCDDPRIN